MEKFKLISLLLIFLSLTGSAFAQKEIDFDTFGYYYIEKPTKAFANISDILLSGDYGKRQNPQDFGVIRLKNKTDKNFQILEPFQNGRYISFQTTSVEGISYKFSGNFTTLFDKVGANSPGRPIEGVVLEGKLIKLKGNRKIAEQQVKFTYFAGD